MSAILVPKFKSNSNALRSHFEQVMSDNNNPDRFQWDWWHQPGRYTHLRTPAARFFPEKMFAELQRHLIKFGRDRLGCQSLSPMWLSCYIDGCEQKLHADQPHGPWAFVLPLVSTKALYQGGETLLLRPETLSYWNPVNQKKRSNGQDFEFDQIVTRVPALKDRLLVFDPRIPHGVSRVSGTLNPLEGRLVIHGWFTSPDPFVEGPLRPRQAERALLEFDEVLANHFDSTRLNPMTSTGTIAFRILIQPNGKVRRIVTLASTLQSYDAAAITRDQRRLVKLIQSFFAKKKFPSAQGSSSLTLPLTIR